MNKEKIIEFTIYILAMLIGLAIGHFIQPIHKLFPNI